MTTGIYALYWEQESQVYIGRGSCIENRFNSHRNLMLKNEHYNYKVTSMYNKYGLPQFLILEECTENLLDTLEIFYINEFNSIDDGLNINPGGGHSGSGYSAIMSKHSKRTILKVFSLLYSTNMLLTDISSRVGVPLSLMNNILYNNQHMWLKEQYPHQYSLMKTARENSNSRSKRGLRNPMSKYTKTQILKVFSLLYRTRLGRNSIAHRLKVNPSLPKAIMGGSHLWLKDDYPLQYSQMLSIRKTYTP